MLWIITGIIISYLIGSIPTAYLFGKILKGIDIRNFGSGNVGATNALRVLGKKIGILVLLIDILKGLLPVIFLGDYLVSVGVPLSPEATRILLGLCCISGHNWTIFLRFKGGKGVATTLGVLLGLSFRITILGKAFGLVVLVWLATFFISRMVSLASILAGTSFPVFMFYVQGTKQLIFFSLVVAGFIILRHRANLKRIIQGKEPRLYFFQKLPSK